MYEKEIVNGNNLQCIFTPERGEAPILSFFCSLEGTRQEPRFLSIKKSIVADGQKIPQVICTEISRLNIQKSGRSFYDIFSPVYIELSLR